MPCHNFFSRMPFMKPHCRIKSPTTTPLNQPLHQSLPFLWRRWVRQRRGRFRKPWCSWAKPGSSPRRPGSRWRATCVSKSKKIEKQLIIFKCRTLISTHFFAEQRQLLASTFWVLYSRNTFCTSPKFSPSTPSLTKCLRELSQILGKIKIK